VSVVVVVVVVESTVVVDAVSVETGAVTIVESTVVVDVESEEVLFSELLPQAVKEAATTMIPRIFFMCLFIYIGLKKTISLFSVNPSWLRLLNRIDP
jgi:hypothetical protein